MVIPMIAIVLLYIYIVLDILVLSKDSFGSGGLALVIFGIIIILEYGFFAVRSLGYILRLKKKTASADF